MAKQNNVVLKAIVLEKKKNLSNDLVDIRQNPRISAKTGTVAPLELAKRGLPIDSMDALDAFETNLMEEAFVDDIVSQISLTHYFTTNILNDSDCDLYRIRRWR